MKFLKTSHDTSANGLGPPWRVILNLLVIFIASQLIAVFLVELGISLSGAPSSTFNNSVIAQFFYVLIAEGLAAGTALAIVKHKGLAFKTIGFGRRPKPKDVLYALIGFVLFWILTILVNVLIRVLSPNLDNGTQDVGFNNLNGLIDAIIAFVALVIIPPLGEEILVRGYLYSGLRHRLRFWPALLITSILFGAAHLATGSGSGPLWIAGINTFVLSGVLVFLREKTGALYASIVVHALNNLVAFWYYFHGVIF